MIYLPKNSEVISTEDNFLFTSRYMQYGKNMRKDVGMLTNGEYAKQKTSKKKLPLFIIEKDYNTLSETQKKTEIPYGLLFLKIPINQSIPHDDYMKLQGPILSSLGKSEENIQSTPRLPELKLLADIPTWYARAYANTGLYVISQYKDYESAYRYFITALTIDSNSSLAYEGLGDYFVYKKACVKAEAAYDKTTEIDIVNVRAYSKLYNVVTNCLHDNVKAKELREFFSSYPSLFGNIASH